MATAPTLPLSLVVDVSVSVSAQAAATPSFNQGLILGNSGIIPASGGNSSRIRQYSSLSAMLADGFTATEPEYLAAQLYFGQSPAPSTVWIGAQDPTAVATLTIDSSAAGTGYQVGDVLTLTQSGAQGATFSVTTIGTNGVITGGVLSLQGSGYSVAAGVATAGGHGTAAEVNITAVGETILQALVACRAASSQWYTVMACGAAKADHLAAAAYCQGATPQCVYVGATADADVLSGVQTNVLYTMQQAAYTRALMLYATTQSGNAPNNAYAAAAVMGVAMGSNTGAAGSYFTLKFKQLAGVTTEPLTQTQVLAIEALNGNVNVNYAGQYTWIEQGTMPSGIYFDQVLQRDMLASDLQYSMVNALIAQPSIPQSNPGMAILLTLANAACSRAVVRGYLAPGTWTGQTVLNVSNGTALPLGYLCQAQPVSAQSAGDRAKRKSMPIYITAIEAGAVHSITIAVSVQN